MEVPAASAGPQGYRAEIEHIQSGERREFTNLQDFRSYLETRLHAGLDDPNPITNT